MIINHLWQIAFTLGPFSIHYYGLAFVLTYFIIYVALKWQQAKTDLPTKRLDVEDLLFVLSLGMIIGARLGFVLATTLDGTGGNGALSPSHIVALWQGGLSFHGGLVGGSLALMLWSKRRGRSVVRVADALAPLLPIGGILVRLANFLAADLKGRPTISRWFVQYPGETVHRYPSQLYEAALYALLLTVLFWLRSKQPRPGLLPLSFLIGALVIRFLVDFMREPTILLFTLTPAQWISLTSLAVLALLALLQKVARKTEPR